MNVITQLAPDIRNKHLDNRQIAHQSKSNSESNDNILLFKYF
jgi:hypothetical protein